MLVFYLFFLILLNLRYCICNLYLNGCLNVIILYLIKGLLKYLIFVIVDLNKFKLLKKKLFDKNRE